MSLLSCCCSSSSMYLPRLVDGVADFGFTRFLQLAAVAFVKRLATAFGGNPIPLEKAAALPIGNICLVTHPVLRHHSTCCITLQKNHNSTEDYYITTFLYLPLRCIFQPVRQSGTFHSKHRSIRKPRRKQTNPFSRP